MKSYSEFDVVDYIEATDEEREEMDGEFELCDSEIVAALHICGPEAAGTTHWRGC